MNRLLKIIVSLIQIGGGLVGINLIGQSLVSNRLTNSTVIINIVFIVVFLFGILAGAALLLNSKSGLLMSALFQAIQIPIYKGSMLAYSLFSGACLKIYWHKAGYGFNFMFGSSYHFSIDKSNTWMMGVNILALVLLFLLVREMWSESPGMKIRERESSFERQARHIVRGKDEHTHGSPLRRALH
jgi:hypothetical protein